MILPLSIVSYRSHFGTLVGAQYLHKLSLQDFSEMAAALLAFFAALKEYGKRNAESRIYRTPMPFDPMDDSVVAHTLHDAARDDMWDTVFLLLEQCPHLVNATAWADAVPEVPAVDQMLAVPAVPAFPRLCPLGQAIFHQNHVAAQRLIERGANIYLRCKDHRNGLTTMFERAQFSSVHMKRVFATEDARLRAIVVQNPSLAYVLEPTDPPPAVPDFVRTEMRRN